jgi:predicted transposase/invertase (TIGR01784 family)
MLRYVIIKGKNKDKEQVVNFIQQTFSEKTGSKMTTIAEQFIQEGEIRGKIRGKQETKLEIAINLILDGMDIKKIARMTGLLVEDLMKIKSNYSALCDKH